MAIVETSALFNINITVSLTQAAIKMKWLDQVSAPAKLLPVRVWHSLPHSTAQGGLPPCGVLPCCMALCLPCCEH